jgi:hypothetical protein
MTDVPENNLTLLYAIFGEIEIVALTRPTTSITPFDVNANVMLGEAPDWRIAWALTLVVTPIVADALPSSMLMFLP